MVHATPALVVARAGAPARANTAALAASHAFKSTSGAGAACSARKASALRIDWVLTTSPPR